MPFGFGRASSSSGGGNVGGVHLSAFLMSAGLDFEFVSGLQIAKFHLLDARVDDVMTRSPKSVRPDQLLSETLDILNSMKVTALFAVETGKPVGIIHVHDLLRTGAA